MSGLWIESLTLSHFRSHKQETLNLDERPVALFGANGAGKTNVLEALSLLSPGRGIRRAGTEEIAREPERLGWKVAAVLHAPDRIHEIETRAEHGANRVVSIDEKSAPQVALGRISRMVWLVPAMDRLWLEGAEGRRRFLDRMTLSFEPGHAEASLAYSKAMAERNRLLKDMVRDAMWYAALEERMAEAGAAIIANRNNALARLQSAMDKAETAFPVADMSIEMEAPNEKRSLLSALQEGRQNDVRAGRTLVGPHRADMQAIYRAKNLQAKQCSTGEQKALLLSLILANARALAEDFGAPPIMLLDEVAAHLDQDRRAALYDEICALKTQAWMTGTEAELFEGLGDRAQQFEVSEADGTSTISAV